MRVLSLAVIAFVGSTQAVKYIDNGNFYAKVTGRKIEADNAGNLAYDEIYNMSEEKDQNMSYKDAVNTINARKQKAKDEEARKKKDAEMKEQKEREEMARIQAEAAKDMDEKKGVTAKGTFEVKSFPQIETTAFN